MTSNECLNIYRDSVNKADLYMHNAFQQTPNNNYVHDEDYRHFIVNASILNFFIAWETFLESIFECFITGNGPVNGQVNSCVTPRNEKHAQELLIGINKYFDWSNPEHVRKLSKLYLDEINPIESNIISIQTDLISLKTIRNAAAHLSTTTQNQLDSVASRLLEQQKTNINPTDLITSIKPNTNDNLWEYFKKVLDIAAENIASGLL